MSNIIFWLRRGLSSLILDPKKPRKKGPRKKENAVLKITLEFVSDPKMHDAMPLFQITVL